MITEKHIQGTHSTKIGADKSAENAPNDPKLIYPNCLPKPKNLEFRWKKKASFSVRSLCQQQNIDVSLSHTAKHTKLYFCKDLFDSKVCKKINEV